MSGEAEPNLTNIDQSLGNFASRIFHEAAQATWEGGEAVNQTVEYGEGFSSFRGIPLDSIGAEGFILSASTDGVGTKVEVAERMQDHSTIAHDLIAMSCDDAVIRGGQPFAVTNILDFRRLGRSSKKQLVQLAEGLQEAAREAGVRVLNGETAELDRRVGGYGSFNYNWSSTALWMVQHDRIIDDTDIQPGDVLVGFGESGLRSNGLTAARSAFREAFGEQWHDELIKADGQSHKLGQLALQPSVIYTKAMVDLTGGSDLKREPKAQINGAAHITGGGIPEKLGRTLRNTGLGAEIVDPFELPTVAMLAQAFHPDRISDEDAYSTWCLGQGMITITPETDVDDVIKVASNHGIAAKVIGYVTKQPGIRIRSAGIHKTGQLLSYPAP